MQKGVKKPKKGTFWFKSGAVFKFAQKWRYNQDWHSKWMSLSQNLYVIELIFFITRKKWKNSAINSVCGAHSLA